MPQLTSQVGTRINSGPPTRVRLELFDQLKKEAASKNPENCPFTPTQRVIGQGQPNPAVRIFDILVKCIVSVCATQGSS